MVDNQAAAAGKIIGFFKWVIHIKSSTKNLVLFFIAPVESCKKKFTSLEAFSIGILK